MKQYIVMISMIVLGIFMFNMVAGDDSHSLLSMTKNVWKTEIDERTYQP